MGDASFLFGAGAENPYGICNGKGFIKELLIAKRQKEREALLGEASAQFQLISPNSQKVFIQSICANRERAKNVFGEKLVDLCVKRNRKQPNETDDLRELANYCNDWYRIINDKEPVKHTYSKQDKEIIKAFFLDCAVFFDSLDEKFNDLRNDPLGANGKRVINAYYTIFFLMLTQVYDIPESFDWSFDSTFDLLAREYNNPNLNNHSEKTYYEIIAESKLQKIHISTSNYTDLAQTETGFDVSYLHGRLTWFEDYKRLRFYDISNGGELPKDYDHLIPFIMIPSGVKPIVSKLQLDEYIKFIDGLKESNILCVVGYRFNSEDNHINSIIADWLRSKESRKLIYLDFSSNNQYLDWSSQRWSDGIQAKTCPSNKPINWGELLAAEESILDIQVDSTNSMDHFVALVNELERIY